jgi:hypothetical protein
LNDGEMARFNKRVWANDTIALTLWLYAIVTLAFSLFHDKEGALECKPEVGTYFTTFMLSKLGIVTG